MVHCYVLQEPVILTHPHPLQSRKDQCTLFLPGTSYLSLPFKPISRNWSLPTISFIEMLRVFLISPTRDQ
jgi:hypothetical protein